MFLPGTRLLGLIAMAVFAFDASLLWDLKAGNVSVVEQFLLWLGFACYLEDRRRAFAALVVIASTFKLLPIAFLALLLVPSRTRHASRGLALAGLALFAAIVFAPSWLGPTWAHGYLSSLRIERPYGERNPSALGILDMALHGAPPPGSDRMDRALLGWGLWSGALVALSAPRLRRVWAERDPRQSVFVAAFLFALVAPRGVGACARSLSATRRTGVGAGPGGRARNLPTPAGVVASACAHGSAASRSARGREPLLLRRATAVALVALARSSPAALSAVRGFC